MPTTTTGLNAFNDLSGTNYIHELSRQAMRIGAEMNNPAVLSSVTPQPVDVLRRQIIADGTPSQGIPELWQTIPGLTDIFGQVILPAAWNKAQVAPGMPVLRDTQRVVLLVDVPSAGGIGQYDVVTTDRIKYEDPIYGDQIFDIKTLMPSPGPGIVRMVVEYAREEHG